ncbi:MAG: Nif3-like dinuclear metal center hexameric protein, partial [Clostridia bacterium]
IANKVPSNARVADIGTDHAYIPIYLLQNNISNYIIASDVRKGPIQKAQNNIKKYELLDKIEIRLGNGLEKIESNEVDTVIIAGMGGLLISSILSDAGDILKITKRLILQPNTGQEEVRKWLVQNYYKIIDEELVEENDKIYNIMVAELGQEKIDRKIDYYIGKKLVEKKDPLLKKLIKFKVKEMYDIINQLQDKKTSNAVKRIEECTEMLYDYTKLLESIYGGHHMIQCQDIIDSIEEIAPLHLAEDWDNSGLLVGDYTQRINNIMVTLDVTIDVVMEAVEKKTDLIIAHHPLIFKPLKKIVQQNNIGEMLHMLIKNNISVYAAHTNLDICNGGLNDILSSRLNLHDTDILEKVSSQKLNKVVVFVPSGYEDDVRRAMTDAGAGWIGNYSDCTYMTRGIGTFKPLNGTKPFIGKPGEIEKTEEYRLETIIPEEKTDNIIKAMIDVHPYEEAAYDIYPLKVEGNAYGLGRIGTLKKPMVFKDFVFSLKEALGIEFVKCVGDENNMISKVAVCTGSGAEFITAAVKKNVDVFITGDVKYHQAQIAQQMGMNLVDAGHYETENIVVPFLIDYLSKKLENEGVKIYASEKNPNVFRVI